MGFLRCINLLCLNWVIVSNELILSWSVIFIVLVSGIAWIFILKNSVFLRTGVGTILSILLSGKYSIPCKICCPCLYIPSKDIILLKFDFLEDQTTCANFKFFRCEIFCAIRRCRLRRTPTYYWAHTVCLKENWPHKFESVVALRMMESCDVRWKQSLLKEI